MRWVSAGEPLTAILSRNVFHMIHIWANDMNPTLESCTLKNRINCLLRSIPFTSLAHSVLLFVLKITGFIIHLQSEEHS